MRTIYGVWRGNELRTTKNHMYEAIEYIRNNLLDERPTSISVSVSKYETLTANKDMHMVDFLSWLGEQE